MPAKTRERRIRDVCKIMWEQIRSTWGNGWRCLGDEIKRAVVTERVFHVFAGRAGIEGQTVKPEEMSEYLYAMLDYCGLGTDDEE